MAAALAAAKGATTAAALRHANSGKAFKKKVERQHNVYEWVSTAPGMELVELKSEDMANALGVKEAVVKDYVEGELKAESDILTLPWALISVVLYALVLITHEGPALANSVQAAIDFDIEENANFAFSAPQFMGHKNFEDVNSYADFWSWMNKGFMPLTNQAEHATSESSGLTIGAKTDREKQYYLWHNRRIGPIRLAQETLPEEECPNTYVADAFNITCLGTADVDMALPPSELQVQQAVFKEDKSKTMWLKNFDTDTQDLLHTLEQEQWLNTRTGFIKISFLTYTANIDLLMMTHVNFMFARSGRIWKKITHESMPLDAYPNFWAYIYDLLFYMQVTVLFCWEFYELCKEMFRSGHHPLVGFKKYISVWNAVDWVFIVTANIALILWIVRVVRIKDVESALLALPPEASSCTVETCATFFDPIFQQVTETGSFKAMAAIFAAVLPMVIMLRMFKAFSAQPRLALVTATLQNAWTNLSHYLIVFVAIFGSYAIMAVAFFGREVADFATMDRAIPTCFLMVMGDFDFSMMEINGRGYAFFFFLTFMFLIVLIMLSMLIAIIMDVYVEVKTASKSSESIWSDTYDLITRAWQNRRKSRIGLHKILPVLCQGDDELMTVDSFMDEQSPYYIPGMTRVQAMHVLKEAIDDYNMKMKPEVSPENIIKYIYNVVDELQPFCSKYKGAIAHSPTCPEDLQADMLGEPRSPTAHKSYSPEELCELVPLEELLKAATLKIKGGHAPSWPGASEVLSQAISSAQAVSMRLTHVAAV